MQESGNRAGREQDVDQRLVKLEQETFPARNSAAIRDAVRAEVFETLRNFSLIKSLLGSAAKQAAYLFDPEMVPLRFVRGGYLFQIHNR